jgi:hypothetical protein
MAATKFFEAMQERVQRGDVKTEEPVGTDLDQLGNVIAVARLGFEQGENQKLGASPFPLEIRLDIAFVHIWESDIWTPTVSSC